MFCVIILQRLPQTVLAGAVACVTSTAVPVCTGTRDIPEERIDDDPFDLDGSPPFSLSGVPSALRATHTEIISMRQLYSGYSRALFS